MADDEKAGFTKIGNLDRYSRDVDTIVKVVSKTEPRSVSGGTHLVADALVGDETGSIYMTLWDNDIDKIEEGQVLKMKNAYVKLFRGSMRLNLGRFGSYELTESAPFEDVNLDNNLSSRLFQSRYSRPFGESRRYGGRRRRRY